MCLQSKKCGNSGKVQRRSRCYDLSIAGRATHSITKGDIVCSFRTSEFRARAAAREIFRPRFLPGETSQDTDNTRPRVRGLQRGARWDSPLPASWPIITAYLKVPFALENQQSRSNRYRRRYRNQSTHSPCRGHFLDQPYRR